MGGNIKEVFGSKTRDEKQIGLHTTAVLSNSVCYLNTHPNI